jgi:hypothetical protein
LNLPAGQYVHIPSGVTGKIIYYFIPDPLRDLLMRCAGQGPHPDPTADDELGALGLLDIVARRGYAGFRDPVQAAQLFELLWSATPVETVSDVHVLAPKNGEKPQEIRQQIVFTGSRVASEAVHVYAPHEAVPELIEQLMEGILSSAENVSPVDRVAVLGFFCLHVHPYQDGNGRWARALTVAVERRSLVTTMAALSFQTLCMKALAEAVWPKTRAEGLGRYLELSRAYTQLLLAAYRDSEIFSSLKRVSDALRKTAKTKPKIKALCRRMFVDGCLDADETSRLLGVSARVVDGLFQALEAEGLKVSQKNVLIEPLLIGVEAQAKAAAAITLNHFEG